MIYRKVAHSIALLLEIANVRETPVKGTRTCEIHRHGFKDKFRFSRGTVILIQQRSGNNQHGFPTGPHLGTASHLTQTGPGSIPGQSGYPIQSLLTPGPARIRPSHTLVCSCSQTSC